MGVNVHGVRLLCYAKHLEADFDCTATIGRQRLSLSKRQMGVILKRFHYEAEEVGLDAIMTGADGYVDALLSHLGAREVHAFDYSDY